MHDTRALRFTLTTVWFLSDKRVQSELRNGKPRSGLFLLDEQIVTRVLQKVQPLSCKRAICVQC